jgi:threonyl-tRNA synthetase
MAKVDREKLQRVYGITFPNSKLMKDWKTMIEEAQKRDHRIIGKMQELFMLDSLSPGNVFFLPHGTRVYNTLQNFLRKEYYQRGYQEVITPVIFNKELWVKSGHWDNYRYLSTPLGNKVAQGRHVFSALPQVNIFAKCLISILATKATMK